MMLGCGKRMELKRGKEWAVCVWAFWRGILSVHDIANRTRVTQFLQRSK
jgi:hypothetical protein